MTVHCKALSIVVALVLAGAPLPGLATVPADGDANGDQRVDVLDLQRVIAAVLHDAPADAAADVNGDGRVDILDYQYVLERAATPCADPPPAPAPPEVSVQAVPAAPMYRPCPPAPSWMPVVWVVDERHAHVPAWRAAPRRVRLLRYVYRLTPHAPPAADRL